MQFILNCYKAMRKKILIIFSIMTFVFMISGCKKKKLKLATGSLGGNYYTYGINLSKDVETETKYKMETITTDGSKANIRLVDQGFADMALVQSDVLSDFLNENQDINVKALTGLYTESLQIVVSKNSEINNVSDLVNKKISIGLKDSGSATNAIDILNAYSIKTYEAVNLSYDDSANALKNGEIDAFFVTASYPTKVISDISNDVKILSIDNSVATSILQENSAYQKVIIKKGTYGNSEDIETIGVSCILIANKDLDDDICNSVIDVLKNHNDHLQDISFGKDVVEENSGRRVYVINMYLTLAIAVLSIYVGKILKRKIKLLEKFCIPSPVIGGLVFAIIGLIIYLTGIVEIQYDETLKNICMMIFFTSVGFHANIKVLKKGGFKMLLFLVCIIALIFSQNLISVGISKLMNISPLVGLSAGSISMVGGHGTSGAFGSILEDLGLAGATTLCTTSATFGLILGSLMGGPIGRRLTLKHNLVGNDEKEDENAILEDYRHGGIVTKYSPAAYQIAVAMGLGTIISLLLSKTGMTFPSYIGAMIIAAIIRNISEYTNKFEVHMDEINDIGSVCLSLFLGVAMITLKLWQLASLALPLFVLLFAQTIFMIIFSYFIVFNVMGRSYDAAVLASGTCGFGMGATPNAMANMHAVTEKYGPSIQAFLLVPIVGSMFADFINSLVITLFINIV